MTDVESSGWGRLDGRAVEIREKYLAAPSILNPNTWFGWQADPWGDGLSSREEQIINFRKNGGENS